MVAELTHIGFRRRPATVGISNSLTGNEPRGMLIVATKKRN
jgi:hypothetical protein